EPLHAQYSDDDRSVVVVNDTAAPAKGLKVRARVLDLDLKPLFTREAAVDVDADGVARAFVIPAPTAPTYFIRLDLNDGAGKPIGTNFYWLSAREDVLDWDKTDWYHTPVRTHADLTALARLPKTTLRLSRLDPGLVRVENTGSALAFQVRLKLTRDGEEVLPVLWQDNYFELLPGEAREIRVQYSPSPAAVSVEATAWNAEGVLQGAVPSRAR
ncbi:MAG TPA: glycoside hydrolase family 2 protein, partial [Vicinamibacteria bacterium]|nr:glycoside hydrolase family 2 protein [Vicinamibacteria bacterium]